MNLNLLFTVNTFFKLCKTQFCKTCEILRSMEKVLSHELFFLSIFSQEKTTKKYDNASIHEKVSLAFVDHAFLQEYRPFGCLGLCIIQVLTLSCFRDCNTNQLNSEWLYPEAKNWLWKFSFVTWIQFLLFNEYFIEIFSDQ